ncbi:sensor histidine kinase [Ideonella livida]|uniref:histidine kinase n=1 Tax=Ideonella livida TaxID=2707176 RepID=A0A7C9TKE8_9BURK|nr:ATP-binding protein [Ideonella livida]NDY91802.1 hypothetical protein [Ideonella livida]
MAALVLAVGVACARGQGLPEDTAPPRLPLDLPGDPPRTEGRKPRVLVVTTGPAGQIGHALFVDAFQVALTREHPGVVVEVDALDNGRVTNALDEAALRGWLVRKYRKSRYDAVVISGATWTHFLVSALAEIWPGQPVLFSGPDPALLPVIQHAAQASALLVPERTASTLALLPQLLPGTRRLVVLGTDVAGSPYHPSLPTLLRNLAPRLQVEDLTGLPQTALAPVLARQAPGTAALLILAATDRDGRRYEVASLVREAAAHLPVLSDVTTVMGHGALGGPMLDIGDIGRQTAAKVGRLLSGDQAAWRQPEVLPLPPLVLDWRQAQQWGVDLAHLPVGTQLLHRPPSMWESHGGTILAGLAVLTLQSTIIVVLLAERRRRRQAQQEAHTRLLQVARMNRIGSLGELSASLAHELNQPLAAIQANAEAGQLQLRRHGTAATELPEILQAIGHENARAAGIIRRLRALVEKRPLAMAPMDLAPLAEETCALLAGTARQRSVTLLLERDTPSPQVLGDPVALQQVLLNLLLNALEACAGQPAAQVRLSLARAPGGGLQVDVQDNGPGVPEALRDCVLEPFFTTKDQGVGVGLSVCRGILEAHYSTLVLVPAGASPGAHFSFTLRPAEKTTTDDSQP